MLKLDIKHQPFPPENEHLEYKEQLTNNIKREMGAFLNNAIVNGITESYIVLGVNDDIRKLTKPYDAEARHLFEEHFSAWLDDSFHPSAANFAHLEYKHGLFYIKVDSSYHKVFSAMVSKNHRNFRVYIRRGSLSRPAHFTETRQMLLKSMPHKIDSMKSPTQKLTFNYFKQKLNSHKLPLDLHRYDGIYMPNTNKYTITGLVLSDQNPCNVSLAFFNGNSSVSPFLDNEWFNGSILKQIDNADSYLQANDHKPAKVVGAVRKGIRDYPRKAIRESLVNAEVHRAYTTQAAVIVKIFKRDMTISSPGVLPDGMSKYQALKGHSNPTNPHLFGILAKLNYVEHIGNGLNLVRHLYDDSTKNPDLNTNGAMTIVTLPNRNYKENKTKAKHRVRASQNLILDYMLHNPKKAILIINKFKHKTYKSPKTLIMRYFEAHKYVSRKQVMTLCHISHASASLVLKQLVQKKLIKKTGQGRGTKYYKR